MTDPAPRKRVGYLRTIVIVLATLGLNILLDATTDIPVLLRWAIVIVAAVIVALASEVVLRRRSGR